MGLASSKAAALTLKVAFVPIAAQTPEELEAAFRTATAQQLDITGFSYMSGDLAAKRLDPLRSAFSRSRRIAAHILGQPQDCEGPRPRAAARRPAASRRGD